MGDRKDNITVKSSSSDGGMGIVVACILFVDFGDNSHDLYDLICKALLKFIGE